MRRDLEDELGLDEPLLISPVYFRISAGTLLRVHENVSDHAAEVIRLMPHSCAKSSYDVLVIPGRVEDMENPESLKTLPYMREFAHYYGLIELPVEAALLLWGHLNQRVLTSIGLRSIIAMHEPVRDEMGISWLFQIGMYENAYRLGAVPNFAGETYPPDRYGFAFLIPKLLVPTCRREFPPPY